MTNKKVTLIVLLFSLWTLLPPGASAETGGLSGGGGDILKRYTLAPSQVQQEIQKVADLVPYALNAIEILSQTSVRDNEVYNLWKKIALHSNDLRARLPRIQFEFRTEETCYDHEGKPAIASAITANGVDKLCFYVTDIAKKLDAPTAQKELFGLVMHEISHLVGASEKEATLLQISIARNSLMTDNVRLMLQTSLGKLKNDLAVVIQELKNVRISLSSTGSVPEKCLILKSAEQTKITQRLSNVTEISKGVTLLTRQDEGLLMFLYFRTVHLHWACIPENMSNPYTNAFAGTSEIPYARYLEIYGQGNHPLAQGQNETIRFIGYGKFDVADDELGDIVDRLQKLRDRLPVNL